jgi:hypothetical protein
VSAANRAAPPRARRASSSLAVLWRLAVGDFLERARRPGLVLSLFFMVWLTNGMLPPALADYRTFVMHDRFRPEYGPEWVGTIVGLLCGLYFLLVGFYLVRGSIERDRRTGVGPILAAARVSRRRYLASKALSHLMVFTAMLAVALVVALISQQLLGENRHFDPFATALSLFAIALPVAAIVAAGAVLFECIPWLAGGGGNVAWFVVSMGLLVSGLAGTRANAPGLHDLLAIPSVMRASSERLHELRPEIPVDLRELSLGVDVARRWRGVAQETFPWRGLRWDLFALAFRGAWFVVAAGLVALAALAFDRFERPARVAHGRASRPWTWFPRARPAAAAPRRATSAAALAPAKRGHGFVGLVRAELALLLHGQSAWWHAGAAGLLIATLFAPFGAVRFGLLPVLSVWPMLLLGALGARDRLCGTEPLLFSVARPVTRMIAAGAAAGMVLYLALGAPALLRFVAAGHADWAAGWALGSLLVPAAALAFGTWTGGTRFFEVLLLFTWYIGPMHRLAALDYTGVTAPRSPATWAAYVALTAALLAAAWAGRARLVRR